jgi:hypothetical protein
MVESALAREDFARAKIYIRDFLGEAAFKEKTR